MGNKLSGLQEHWKNKTNLTIEKVDDAIRELAINGEKINFNTVAKRSGVSKNFLYSNEKIKQRIEELRNKQVNQEINQRAKFDKTSKSKDVIIEAKDKKIAKLEEENIKLKLQIQFLQTRLYEQS